MAEGTPELIERHGFRRFARTLPWGAGAIRGAVKVHLRSLAEV